MNAFTATIVAVVAVAFPAATLAESATTGPGQRATITVNITDKGLSVSDQATFFRGAIVTFEVYNGGKKLHDFTLLGKTTGPIKPKRWGHFTVTLLTRGQFPEGSTLDKGPAFHGKYTVT